MQPDEYKTTWNRCEVTTTPSSCLEYPATISAPTDLTTGGQQKLVLEDLQETVPEVSWDFFDSNILPPLPDCIKLQDVVSSLKDSGKVVEHEDDRIVWQEFELGDPDVYRSSVAGQRKEDLIFAKIQKIATAVKQAASRGGKALRLFFCNPTRAPESETRDNNTRPDGYYVRNSKKKGVTVNGKNPLWSDIICPCEFKLGNTAQDQNRNWTQILWSLNHLMREDATRRFAIGFTIEAHDMRIWYASRSDVLVSEPINFIEDVEDVTKFFLRLQFSDEVALGFDDTITRVGFDQHGDVQYDIRVDSKQYRTQRLISSIGAESIRGRGTRVWEVKVWCAEEDDWSKETFILKDSWADSKRLREVNIHRNILQSRTVNATHAQVLRDSLLTYSASWDVTVDTSIGPQIDSTRSLMLRGADPHRTSRRKLKVMKDLEASKRVVQQHPAKGETSQVEKSETKHVIWGEKIHHRVVCNEVGTTIMDAKCLSQAFAHLEQLSRALLVLHAAGWVHRDISVGNIIIHNKTVKLGDIEYAKHESDGKVHDVRTGTVFFMATEVDQGEYHYLERLIPPVPTASQVVGGAFDSDIDWMTLVKERAPAPATAAAPPKRKEVTFKHNPLHDMESVLWLGYYLVLCTALRLKRSPHTTEDEWQSYMQAQDEFASTIFHDILMRRNMIKGTADLLPYITNLHPKIRTICSQLEVARVILVQAYETAESDPSTLAFEKILAMRFSIPSDQMKLNLHQTFARLFFTISQDLSDENDIQFVRRPSLAAQRQEMQKLIPAEAPAAPGVVLVHGVAMPAKSRRPRRKAMVTDPEVHALSEQYKRMLRPASRRAISEHAGAS